MGSILKSRLTDISAGAGENMPPAMQLEEETPRHADCSFQARQTRTHHLIEAPEGEAGDGAYGAPVYKSTDFAADGFVGDAAAGYGASFESYTEDHDTWVSLAVPLVVWLKERQGRTK